MRNYFIKRGPTSTTRGEENVSPLHVNGSVLGAIKSSLLLSAAPFRHSSKPWHWMSSLLIHVFCHRRLGRSFFLLYFYSPRPPTEMWFNIFLRLSQGTDWGWISLSGSLLGRMPRRRNKVPSMEICQDSEYKSSSESEGEKRNKGFVLIKRIKRRQLLI